MDSVTASDGGSSRLAAKEVLAARAAWLQLIDGRTNIEIAETLGMSRLRVPKLVRWAEDRGLATVAVHPPAGQNWAGVEALRARFGLVEALVSPEAGLTPAARLAARYVCEVLVEGGLLGVAWGGAVQALVSELEHLRDTPQSDVVQLIGGLPEEDTAWHATEILVRLTAVFGGKAAALLSPMILPDVATARGLRHEPSVAHAFAQMARIDVAVLGIGAWGPGGSRVWAELAPAELRRTRDVVADMGGILLNAQGEVVHPEISERIMSIDAATLADRPVRLALAVEEPKVGAITAALRSGLLTVLCTDSRTADLVLAASSSQRE